MKENQERAEVERKPNLRYGGGSSTALNDFLSDDKEQGSLHHPPLTSPIWHILDGPYTVWVIKYGAYATRPSYNGLDILSEKTSFIKSSEEISRFHNQGDKQHLSKSHFGHKF